jgi:hypothetical protein
VLVVAASTIAGARQHLRPRGSRPVRAAGGMAPAILRRLSPTAALGVRFAFPRDRPARSGAHSDKFASTACLAAATGVMVFAAAVDELVDSPARYGWSWDVMVTCNQGFCGRVEPELGRSVASDPRVTAWGLATFSHGFRIGDEHVPTVAAHTGSGDIAAFTVVEGHPPRSPSDVVLGGATMRDLDVDAGSTVRLDNGAEFRVVGRAVFAGVGSAELPRASLATLHPRPSRSRAVLQPSEAFRLESAAPQPDVLLAHRHRLRDLSIRCTVSCEQHDPRSLHRTLRRGMRAYPPLKLDVLVDADLQHRQRPHSDPFQQTVTTSNHTRVTSAGIH